MEGVRCGVLFAEPALALFLPCFLPRGMAMAMRKAIALQGAREKGDCGECVRV